MNQAELSVHTGQLSVGCDNKHGDGQDETEGQVHTVAGVLWGQPEAQPREEDNQSGREVYLDEIYFPDRALIPFLNMICKLN